MSDVVSTTFVDKTCQQADNGECKEITVMPTRPKHAGDIIKQARLKKGLTVRQAAERLDMDFGYYAKIENGQVRLPKNIRPIAKFYGLDHEELTARATPSLPSLAPYLRAKYDLDDEAVAELEQVFNEVRQSRRRGRS